MLHFQKLFLSIIIFLSFTGCFLSQNGQKTNLNYEDIEKKIDSLHNEPEKMWSLINFYIKNSKKDKNFETLVYAYRYASMLKTFPNNLKYADSALTVSQSTKNEKLLTISFLNRGIVFMGEDQYQKALDDILLANKYSKNIDDPYTTYKTVYYIAQNKLYLGLYEDANKELKDCLKYFRNNLGNETSSLGKNYEMYYLYSLMSYIDSNSKIGKAKDNDALIKEAFDYINQHKLDSYKPYFISIEGTNAFYNDDYKTAISKLSEAIKLYNDQWPHITEIFYLGMSYSKIGKPNVALKYFEEIDNQYNKTKKLDPHFRAAYEFLIKYYEEKGDKEKQLEYINKLMKLDRSYEKNYKYLYTKINKEYDTQKLLAEKNKIEESLNSQKRIYSILLLISILIISFVVYQNYRMKKIYKKRFEEIMNSQSIKDYNTEKISILEPTKEIYKPITTDYYEKIPGLNPTFVEEILQKLKEFEAQNKFLDAQISQKLLSENFGTNSTYLSKIINAYKGKNFNAYINDLRLDYIIDKMKSNPKYLNMDVKELSSHAGFGNTENFSDNFQRKFQIKPSYFIKMMKENYRNASLLD